MHRDTPFTIIVYPEMYRYTVFTIVIYPERNDTVSLAVSSRFFCVLCFFGCTRASFLLVGHSNTRVSPDVPSQGSLSKVSNEETSQLAGILLSRVVQRTLGKYAALSVGVDQVGNLVLSRVADQVGNLDFSCCVPGAISWYEGE